MGRDSQIHCSFGGYNLSSTWYTSSSLIWTWGLSDYCSSWYSHWLGWKQGKLTFSWWKLGKLYDSSMKAAAWHECQQSLVPTWPSNWINMTFIPSFRKIEDLPSYNWKGSYPSLALRILESINCGYRRGSRRMRRSKLIPSLEPGKQRIASSLSLSTANLEINLEVMRCPSPSPSSSDIPNGDLPVVQQKTSGKASCMQCIQMHFMAPWLVISVAWMDWHIHARLWTPRMERKDVIERIFSSRTCSVSFMFRLGLLLRLGAVSRCVNCLGWAWIVHACYDVEYVDLSTLVRVKKSTRSYLLYLLTSYVLAERVEYMKDTFASASSEICVLGGSYFGYSVFPGVMLASLMHSPEPLFQTCNSFY